MIPINEELLLSQARKFEQEALATVYEQYSDAVYYYALRFLGDVTLAEDCTAETFARFLRAIRDGGGPTTKLKAYLYRSAHNWIVDHYRRIPILPLDPDSEKAEVGVDPSMLAEDNILRKKIIASLRYLTLEQQQVIALRYFEGWDIAEIAESLKKPVGAIKSLQHRAVSTLQKILIGEEKA